ncbi:hypothetical protein [Bdellovibrio sp. BCCA]|uniref:hypothetical protein n=1 Tax=Bdellovibrio sp. BCCA TaxID=3136281 RepID=UPI0030F0DFAE
MNELVQVNSIACALLGNLAILNLMRTDDFEPDMNWIAKRLGISLSRVQDGSMERTSSRVVVKTTRATSHHERRKLAEFLEDGPKKEVYSLTINLFPLTEIRAGDSESTNE